MPIDVVVGAQFGGEGKGKVCAYLAATESPKALIRCGGPNSGHSVVDDGTEFKLHMIPTGALYTDCPIILPAGALIHIATLKREAERLKCTDRVMVDPQAGIIRDEMIEEQALDQFYASAGSTLAGTGYAAARRALRRLPLAKEEPEIARWLEDTLPFLMNNCLLRGESVLLEGSQAYGLSNYHGDYPYCTSRDTTVMAMLSQVGVGPAYLGRSILAVRFFPTRNHQGYLPDELSAAEMEELGIKEYGGADDQRMGKVARRAGRLDPEDLERAVWANSPACLALLGADYLDRSCRGETDRRRLPARVLEEVERVESRVGVKVGFVSTGPGTLEMVKMD
jgi:adenylosuccinate synthase